MIHPAEHCRKLCDGLRFLLRDAADAKGNCSLLVAVAFAAVVVVAGGGEVL